MSETHDVHWHETEGDPAADVGVSRPQVNAGSLEERIAQRREALEATQTDLFDVPGYEGIFQVELQVVGGKRQHAIVNRYERVHDEYQKTMRICGDLILAATVAFHPAYEGTVAPEDRTPIDTSWKRLAVGAARKRGHSMPESVEGRAALVYLLTENGVADLAGEWKIWMRTRGQKLEAELERDF